MLGRMLALLRALRPNRAPADPDRYLPAYQWPDDREREAEPCRFGPCCSCLYQCLYSPFNDKDTGGRSRAVVQSATWVRPLDGPPVESERGRRPTTDA